MKSLTQSKILQLVVSFVIAVLLSAYVMNTRQAVTRTNDGQEAFQNIVSQKTETLTVDLALLYDSSQYVVVGAPSQVQVKITGPEALITSTANRQDIRATLDLRELEAGAHEVRVNLTGVNSDIRAEVEPESVSLTLAKKLSRDVPVVANYNEDNLPTGYQVEDVTLADTYVTITGPESNVQSVDHVNADIDLSQVDNDTVKKTADLQAVDAQGNPIEVNIAPRTTEVTVTFNSEVEKELNLEASVNNGDAADYVISLKPEKVTVNGNAETLSGLDTLLVPVDVKDITGPTTKTVTLHLPDGITRANEDNIEVTITPKATQESSEKQSSATSSEDSADSSSE